VLRNDVAVGLLVRVSLLAVTVIVCNCSFNHISQRVVVVKHDDDED